MILKWLHETSAVALRIITELLHTRRALIFWIVFPSLMLLLFGLIYADNSKFSKSFDYTAPGILVGAALFFSCLGGPTTLIVAERERHTLRRLLLSPLSGSAYFSGVVLAHLIAGIGQTCIVYGIAFLFGARFRGSILLGAAIIFLCVASYAGLGFFFGARVAKRTEDAMGPISAVGVPLLVLGGTFFPPSYLPNFLLIAAHANPIFHMNEALRPVSAQHAGFAAVADHVLFLVVFAILAQVVGIISYGKMLLIEKGN